MTQAKICCMPSQDYIYDLADKLDGEKFDYLIIAFKKNQEGNEAPATMLFSLEDETSKKFMFKCLTVFKKELKN